MKAIISVWFFCLLVQIISAGNYNYFWRNFDGSIPSDAVPAGFRVSHAQGYIGQGVVQTTKNAALLPVLLVPEQTSASTYYQGQVTISTELKILCAYPVTAVHWVSTTSATYLSDMVDKNPIIGGVELLHGGNKNYTLHIGKGRHNGKWVFGRVNHSNQDYVTLTFPEGDSESSIESFQVLVAS